MNLTAPKIDLLPEHLIDQIKAGEVIERPGNLLKEILENAVDAGSTKLEVMIKNNGLDLISLKDNGHGMRFNDLPLAFSRHATSKITRFEDLYRLHSYGFRGEALASIAAISKLQCISKVAGAKEAAEIRIEGGLTVLHQERALAGVHSGTELVIQDLFHNTPVRLKFIQSATSEKQFIRKILFSFVLGHPHIEFHIKIDDQDKEIYPATADLKERIESMVPKAKGLLLFNERSYEDNNLKVFLIPGHIKTPVKWQNVYINDRLVLDKQLHRVTCNALLSGFGQDDFHYLVFFDLPPDCIDVNVHPNKTIIKCMDSSKMISLLTSTVKEMNKAQMAPRVQTHSNSEPAPTPAPLLDMAQERNLLQERHDYNMEGIFSPHRLDQEQKTSLFWMDSFFVRQLGDLSLAVNSLKLVTFYMQEKLKTQSLTIPLLVSEPWPAVNVKPERLKVLAEAGMEIEYLSKDTLVLRGIPEWMNGFPLRETLPIALFSDEQNIQINPKDWSESTWVEMLELFPLSFLMEKKIALDLQVLLKEKLK